MVCHNLLLGHGMAVKAYREGGYHGRIGMSMGYFPTDPATDSREDRLAAQRDWESQFGWFTDPVYKGHYPEMMWEYYTKKGVVLPEIKEGDMETISAPVDFLGVNFYRTAVMRHCDGAGWPYDNEYVPNVSEKINRLYRHRPEKLYDYLKRINDEYMPGEIIISENGFSNQETTDRYGRIMDYDRIDYLYRHIEQCIRARENGIPVSSYYVWCFLDDLEWTGGCATRMGLVRVNYETQERTVKESGRWYQRVIRERCLTD